MNVRDLPVAAVEQERRVTDLEWSTERRLRELAEVVSDLAEIVRGQNAKIAELQALLERHGRLGLSIVADAPDAG